MQSRSVLTSCIAFALVLTGLGGAASSATASFHEIKVREVSAGDGNPNTSYVELQMYAPGQNFLSLGAKLAICNDICSLFPAEFTAFSDVPGGANQSTVVIGDSAVPSGSRDFTRDLNIESVTAGGAACYVSEPGFSDCLSWGNFSNNNSLITNYGASADPGSPAPALASGMALRRSISAGCPTALEAGDDTNSSAVDFAATAPNPRPNSVAPTEALCSTGTSAPPPGSKKKKCKKAKKKSSPAPGNGYAAKKKCKKKKRK